MITNLHLKRCVARSRKSVIDEGSRAWWIAGDHPMQWLQVISAVGLPQVELSLYPLMDKGGKTKGVFVRAKCSHAHSPSAAVPFREIVSGFWVPWDSELVPSVAEDESIQLTDELVFLPDGSSAYINHAERLGVSDLLAFAGAGSQSWNFAMPSDSVMPRITSIAMIQPIELDDVMDEAGDGVGEKSPKELLSKSEKFLDATKRKLGKDSVGVPAKFLLGGALVAAKGLSYIGRLLGKLGSGSSIQHGGPYRDKPSLLDRLTDWLNKKHHDISGSQNRELDRLVQLLKDDPDRGLQFALPLNGESGRGLGAGNAFLGRNKVDFDLSGLSSSGRIDPWDVSGDTFFQLQNAYREAANREARIGRHRKAAYIHGNLLGDMAAAADVLKQGGYYSEAAQVYLKKLGDKKKAAQCYAEAGMVQDAVVLYEEMQEHMAIAFLYAELGKDDLARESFVSEAERLQSIGQTVKAAEIWKDHLIDLPQGLELLKGAWPSSDQAEDALSKEFEWYEEFKMHDAANARLKELINKVDVTHAGKMACVLAELAGRYSDPGVVEELQDATRLAIACDLKHEGGSRLSITASQKLGERDAVLRRDVQRYRAANKKDVTILPTPVAKRGGNRADFSKLEFVSSVKLPDYKGHKTSVVDCKHGFVFAVGGLGRLSIFRILWAGGWQVLKWRKKDLLDPKSMEVYENRETMYLVVDAHPSRLDSQTVKGENTRGEKTMSVRFFTEDYDDVVAATYDDCGNLLEMRVVNHQLVLHSKSLGGVVTTRHLDSLSHLVDASLMKEQLPMMKMIYAHGDIYLIAGASLVRVMEDDIQITVLPWMIDQLKASPAFGRPRIFVYSTSGSAMIWVDKEMHLVLLDEEAVLGATFTTDGVLLCRHQNSISARTVHSEETIKYPRTLDLPSEINMSVHSIQNDLISTGERGEIALFSEKEMVICRLQ